MTGPSVYARSSLAPALTSWARALSESEEAARHMDNIIVLIIFSSPVVIYPYSANTRINLTCPECCEVDISASRNICREKPVFAEKVTCGALNETGGQSWPSNTGATNPFTGQN